MKHILLAGAIFGLLLAAPQRAQAEVDVSIDFFYNNLTSGGSWVEVADYGYCWQPTVAVSSRDWRPYTDGYWAYTDVGWTWISNEDFGWATYHYGRWVRLRGHGWVWVPGREWGPAWVSWRTGGDYVGWAPLPPRRGYVRGGEVVYEGRPITGYVDIDFDIGPAYYNFVDIRYIGEPVLRQRILPPAQNVTYITSTVNVTNITYNNSTVYNYGPDYNRLSAYATRPIQRLALRRETSVDLDAALKSNAVTKVEGNTLMVAAPQEFKPAEQNAAPKEVKTKIAKADLETGWSGVSDEKQKAELQAQMKKEDRKSIPPPKIKPQNPAALAETDKAQAAPGASPAEADNGRDKDKDGKKEDRPQPTPAGAVAQSTPAPAPDGEQEKENGKKNDKAKGNDKAKEAKKDNGRDAGLVKPAPTPLGTPVKAPPSGDDRKGPGKKAESAQPEDAPDKSAQAKRPSGKAPREAREQKPNKLPDMQTSERPLMPEKKLERQAAASRIEDGRANRKVERTNVPRANDATAPQEQTVMHKQPKMAPPRGPENAPAQNVRPAKEQKEKKKGKKDEGQPPPES